MLYSNSKLLRLFLALTLLLSLTQAGWFGGSSEKEEPRRRRRNEPEGPEYEPEQPDGDVKGSASNASRRDRLAEMKKNRTAKDLNEMMSEGFNERVIRDETIEETHTPEENLDGYLTDEQINKIWAETMQDFVPEDMTNVIVEKRTSEALFEVINHTEPTLVKGAYYVAGGSPEKTISCIIYDPNRELVYKRKGSAQGIIQFNTTIAGEYAIIFSNMDSKMDLTVTMALHTSDEKPEEVQYDINDQGQRFEVKDGSGSQSDESSPEAKADVLGGEENLAATSEEVSNVRTMLRLIHNDVKKIAAEAKLSMTRQEGHNKDLLENQDWNFYFMLGEVAIFALVLAFQQHHLRKVLDNKLII